MSSSPPIPPNNTDLHCDFCYSQPVVCGYRCPDTTYHPIPTLESRSYGAWAACEACHTFIEEHRPDKVVERAIELEVTSTLTVLREKYVDFSEEWIQAHARTLVTMNVILSHSAFWLAYGKLPEEMLGPIDLATIRKEEEERVTQMSREKVDEPASKPG